MNEQVPSKDRVSDFYLESTLNSINLASALDSQLMSTAFLRMLLIELIERRASNEPEARLCNCPPSAADPTKPNCRGTDSATPDLCRAEEGQPPEPLLRDMLLIPDFLRNQDNLKTERAAQPPPADAMAPIACIRVGEDDTCEVLKLYAPGLPPGEHDLYPAASTRPASTELPDQLLDVHAICDERDRLRQELATLMAQHALPPNSGLRATLRKYICDCRNEKTDDQEKHGVHCRYYIEMRAAVTKGEGQS